MWFIITCIFLTIVHAFLVIFMMYNNHRSMINFHKRISRIEDEMIDRKVRE